MHILILHSGSSSLKFRLVDYTSSTVGADTDPTTVLQGIITGIGKEATLKISPPQRTSSTSVRKDIMNHGQAVKSVWESLESLNTQEEESLENEGSLLKR